MILLRLVNRAGNSRSLHCAHPHGGFASVGMTIHFHRLLFYEVMSGLTGAWLEGPGFQFETELLVAYQEVGDQLVEAGVLRL